MCCHFQNHKNQAACNRKLKNVTLTENWKEVKCKLCQRTEQYFMARQESPKEQLSACGKTLDEFMAACNDDCSNVEVDCGTSWQITACRCYSYLDTNITCKGLGAYRIKEPTPLIAKQEADGWNKHEINQASFEPKYTITETKLNELIEIAEYGIECKIPYDGMIEIMQEDALALTSECVEALLKGLIGIRGE